MQQQATQKQKSGSSMLLIAGTCIAVLALGFVIGATVFGRRKKEKMIVTKKGQLKTIEIDED